MKRKRILGAAAIAVATLAGGVLGAGPASAASYDGNCQASAYSLDGNGEFCLYYSPNLTNAVWDRNFNTEPQWGGDPDLGDDWFIHDTGPGQYQVVRNNAASARNRFYGESVYVYRYVNYSGLSVFVGSLSWTNLGTLRNDEASYRWTE